MLFDLGFFSLFHLALICQDPDRDGIGSGCGTAVSGRKLHTFPMSESQAEEEGRCLWGCSEHLRASLLQSSWFREESFTLALGFQYSKYFGHVGQPYWHTERVLFSPLYRKENRWREVPGLQGVLQSLRTRRRSNVH